MSDEEAPSGTEFDIAVVGMAGHFPGAPDVEAFWRNLRDGVESIVGYSAEDLKAVGVPSSLTTHHDYVRRGPPLEEHAGFDAGFFGFNAKDAAIFDPQHRHFLECSWTALEHAGHAPGGFDGTIGVFAGSGMHAYMMFNLVSNPDLVESAGLFLLRHTGNDKDFLATRVSYELNLTGPSLNVQTACSTSLVATHLACQSLLNRECDMALAGGVTIEVPHRRGYLFREGEILSSDGRCRAFDQDADGTVFGSGVGVVVLRRLDDALRDGDCVHAVIKGSAVNNDGSNKVSYLAPSVDGQAAAIAQALAVAGVHPDDITYVEAHGTGTAMGDPIEIAALTQAFRTETARKGFCAVGSVKSNIGHTDTAAGVASRIKVIQALRHGQLPASLHVDRPNPACHFEDTPFHVNAALSDWTTGGKLRRALVSSLGVGGTNAHVVVEQAPAPATSGPSRAWQLLPLSAKTPAALEHATANLITHLKANPGLSLADAAFTYQLGRSPFSERRAVVCRDVADAIFALEGSGPRRVHSATVPDGPGSVAFIFSGQGAQHVDMGLELYEREPVFREAVDRCAEILKPLMDRDLREILYPGQADADASARALRQTQLTQPTLFTIEYALARLWASWGIRPRALIGHSVGEFVAACLAEVFSLEDGLSLVAKRGYLMQGLPSGAMLSVGLPAARVEARLGPDMSLAAINGPHLCVVAGSDAAIARLETELEAEDVACRRLSTSHAFHSAMMELVVGPFAEVVSGVRLSPPRVPIVSTLTGAWMTPGQAVDPMYWARHLREPVRFGEAIAVLLDDPDRVLLEVGPGRTLTTLAGMSLAKQPRHSVVGSLRHPDEAGSDVAAMLDALGQLWLVEVEWSGLHAGERRQRVPLPTYPFEHQDYWVEPGEQAYREGLTEGDRREDIGDWFAQPSWRRSVLPSRAVDMGKGLAGRRLLVLGRNTAFDRRLVALAREQGAEVAVATPGEQFASIGEDAYLIRPSSPRDHERLIDRVAGPQAALDGIVHLWSLTDDPEPARPVEAYERLGDPSFFSLLCLAQAIGSQGLPGPLRLTVVSNGLHEIGTDGPVSPVKALLAGPCRVIPQELPDVTCSSVDVAWPGSDPEQIDCVADRVLRELASDTDDAVVAHRGRDRLVQGFDAIRLEPPRPEEVRVRPGGVYLITGGTGGLGLAVASYLARTAAGVKLVLVSRSRVPGSDATRAGGLAAVQALEEAGAEVLVQRADVTDLDQMTRVIAEARQRFGEIDGVVHAAGVLDDGPIQLKTRKAAERVLAPKVVGTLVLEEALAGRALDFLLLFSSVSAFAGMAGQVDYAASNAFLDAYARYRSARDGTLAVTVNWPAWRQVGMAARLAGGSTIESSTWRPTAHPLLARCLEESESRRIYATDFVVSDQWVLREHRMRSGDCLIPGAGFLELATAAYTDGAGDRVVELRGVYFMVPFVVADDQHRELRVQLDYEGTDAEFVITSGRDGSTEHVRGTITEVDVEPLERRSVAALMRRCSLREETFSGPMRHPQLEFGPRWGCLTRINFGDQEALLTLSLSPEFLSDLDDYRLHPAMLDVATAGAQSLIADFDAETQFFVPVGCTRLRSTGSLPARVYSHVRLRSNTEDHDLAVFDVTVMDEDGVELIRIDEFTMTRVAGPSTLGETVPDGGAARSRDATHAQPPAATAALERALRVGVDTEEGVEALNRILGANTPPQVVVSPYPLDRLFEALQTPSAEEVAEPVTRAGSQSDDQAPGDSHLAAPRTEVESLIARLWQDALGLGQVGVNDNFFGLGGHSLIAIRVSSRLRKAFKVDVPLRVVFDRPTVADLARFIEAATGLGNPVGTLTAGIDDGHPDDSALSPIPIQSRDPTLRPSFAQEQVWFLDQLDRGNPAYSLPEALRLRGRLDVGALERSLSEIVRRHEVLRTRFRLDGTGPVLVIAP